MTTFQRTKENLKKHQFLFEELVKRDQKGMYTKALNDLSGVSQEAELPKNPDLIIYNYGDVTPDVALGKILEKYNL